MKCHYRDKLVSFFIDFFLTNSRKKCDFFVRHFVKHHQLVRKTVGVNVVLV